MSHCRHSGLKMYQERLVTSDMMEEVKESLVEINAGLVEEYMLE